MNLKKIAASILGAVSSPLVQDKIISFLKVKAVERLVVSILSLSGFKAWILTLLAEKVIDLSDEHLIEPLFQEVGYVGDVLEGATVYKRVNDAQDVDEWVSAINDV